MITCPKCKKPSFEVHTYDEYIGDHPQGGYQTFYELKQECLCLLEDKQYDAIVNQAIVYKEIIRDD